MKNGLDSKIKKTMDDLFAQIRNHSELSKLLKDTCEENGVSTRLDEKLEETDYLILGVDTYYNSLGLEETPPSPDCLILVKCQSEGYAMHIVELKGLQSAKRFNFGTIRQKFETCLDDFVSQRFNTPLYQDYKKVKLYLVSKISTYRIKRDRGLELKIVGGQRFEYHGKKYRIEPSESIATIKPCY